MNSAGTVIMVISDLSAIEIEAEVDETDIASVNIGQKVKISLDAFPDTTFQGEVIEVGNSAKTSTSLSVASDQVTNFLVKILINEPVPNIKPGMTASVDITTAYRENTTKIPSGAVVMRPEGTENEPDVKIKKSKSEEAKAAELLAESGAGKKAKKDVDGVFLVKQGKARFAPVKTGIRDQQFVEVISGISAGDSVITGPYKTLRTIKQGEVIKAEKPKFSTGGDSVSVKID
jgi:HlyD family secretion protein